MSTRLRNRATPLLILAACAVPFLLSCDQDEVAFGPQDEDSFVVVVKGKVVDRKGRPIAGAIARALPGGATATSGSDGSFSLKGIPPGSYRVELYRDGYRDTAWKDSVRLGLAVSLDIGSLAMNGRYGAVSGLVQDSAGSPAPRAGIAVVSRAGAVVADGSGRFLVAGVDAGPVRLVAALQGVGWGSLDTIVRSEDTLHGVRIRLGRRGGTVSGKVVGGDGKPVAGAVVTAFGGALRDTTESDGTFLLANVPTGIEVSLDVVASGGIQIVRGVRSSESSRTDLSSLSLESKPSGTVVARSGIAIAYTTDSVVNLVAEIVSGDSTFRLLRHLWSLDGGRNWDTTTPGVFAIRPKDLGWSIGNRSVLYRALAVDGRVSTTGRIVVRITVPPDWTPPRIVRRSPGKDTSFAWEDSVVAVSWEISDDRKLDRVLVDTVESWPDAGTSRRTLVLPVGRTKVRAWARDSAGNVAVDSLFLVRAVRPDKEAPRIVWTRPSRDTVFSWQDSSTTIAWTISDDRRLDSAKFDGKPVALDKDGKAGASASLPVGTTTFRLWARDSAGNISIDSLRLTRKPRPDTTLPLIVRRVPRTDTVFAWADSVATVVWTVTDDRRLDSVRIDTFLVKLAHDSARAQVRLRVGENIVRIRVKDSAGNVARDSLRLHRRPPPDTIPPELVRLSPKSDTTFKWEDSVATVAWKVVDERRLDSVWFDSVPAVLSKDTARKVLGLKPGRNVVHLRARDSAGNRASDSLVLVRAGRTTPLDSSLGLLKVGKGRLSPAFHPDTLGYSDTVDASDTSVLVQAIPLDGSCVVTIGGAQSRSRTISLGKRGTTTTARIVVRAADGDSLVYTLDIHRPVDSTFGIAFLQGTSYGVLLDARDGAVYRTVRIGDQTWMAQNLGFAVDSSWCPAGVADSCDKYGRLYSWTGAMGGGASSASLPGKVRGACPIGWHIPSDTEWTVFAERVHSDPRVGEGAGGTALKSLRGWGDSSGGGDLFGFRALPAGYRFTTNGPTGLYAHFWSATSYDAASAYLRSIYHYYPRFYRGNGDKRSGYSVRCVEDAPDTSTALRSLTLSRGFLAPAFDPAREVYDVVVGASVSSLVVAATASSANARIAVDGGGTVDLATDSVVSVVVTNGSGSRTYSVRVFHDADTTHGVPWNAAATYGVLRDGRDGQEYRTVAIGGRRWMAENLNYGSDSSRCLLEDLDSCGKHGRLYSWSAAMGLPASYNTAVWDGQDTTRQGACPSGWRMPNNAEWSSLVAAIEADPSVDPRNAGTAAKSSSGWAAGGNGNDLLGLRVLPSGYRAGGAYGGAGSIARFWTSTGYGSATAWSRAVYGGYADVYLYTSDKAEGYSVRCVEVVPDTSTALRSLAVSRGTLSPSFDPAKLVYVDTVGASVESLVVTATAVSARAVVAIDGGGRVDLKTDSVINVGVSNGAGERVYAIRVLHRAVDTTWGVSLNASVPLGVLRDPRDGKEYRTVRIGDQRWMAENLDHVVDSSWCHGDEPDSCAKYGRMYSWPAAMGIASGYASSTWSGSDSLVRGVCPAGWHLPSRDDWNGLVATTEAAFRTGYEGWLLKSQEGWNTSGNGIDHLGFRALPAGYRYGSGAYGPGNNTGFWTATSGQATTATAKYLYYNSIDVFEYSEPKRYGYSVRCLEDPSDTATNLLSLTVGTGSLSPKFVSSRLEYEDTVGAMAESLVVEAVAASPAATVVIDGGGRIDLSSDSVVEVRVLTGSSSRVYTIRVRHRPIDTTWGVPIDPAVSHGVLGDVRDGREYRTVQVGDQNWMAENLSYRVDSSWCYDADLDSCGKYGRLYSWSGAMGFAREGEIADYAGGDSLHRGACPAGWHLPSIREWDAMWAYLRDRGAADDSLATWLKSSGGWASSASNGSDRIGFRVLPAGIRVIDGQFYNLGGNTGFWSSTSIGSSGRAYEIELWPTSLVPDVEMDMSYSRSVRCLEDPSDTSTALASLGVDQGTLLPSFHSTRTSYVDTVDQGVSTVVVSPVPASRLATAMVSGGDTVDLSTDSVVTVDVVAGGRTRRYTLRFVHRPAHDSTFGIPWKSGVDYGVLRDVRDNKFYRTVRVGGRNWMAENLDHVVDSSWCYGGSNDSCLKYGRFYTWNAAMDLDQATYGGSLWGGSLPRQGACPAGWHLPSAAEYRDLMDSVEADPRTGADSVGYALRSTEGWQDTVDDNDMYGFRLLPGGVKPGNASGIYAMLWTSTEDLGMVRVLQAFANNRRFGIELEGKQDGYSVRCVEDIPDTSTALAALQVGRGDLVPAFHPDVLSYLDTLEATDTTFTATATAASASAVVSVSGGGRIALATDSVLEFTVTNGSATRKYSIEVVRRAPVADTTWGIPISGSVSHGVLHDGRDGQDYRTVTIGGRVWMAENLNYSSDSSWCPGGTTDGCAKYGRLYSWTSAMALPHDFDVVRWMGDESGRQGVCPTGWHVPEDRDWSSLLDTMAVASGADRDSMGLVVKSRTGWADAGNGSDSLGFRVLPSGYRFDVLTGEGAMAGFWTSTQFRNSSGVSNFRLVHSGYETVNATLGSKDYGFSLRCIRD